MSKTVKTEPKNEIFQRVIVVLTALFTALSGLAGLGSVWMASRQVDAALEVVNRTEQTKYISDYVIAADNVCRELVPPALRNRMIYIEKKNADGSIARPGYAIEQRPDMGRLNLDESFKSNVENLDKASNELSNKARLLVVWSSDKKIDYDIYTFSLQLSQRALNEARRGTTIAPNLLVNARSLCENWVDEALSRYMRSRG